MANERLIPRKSVHIDAGNDHRAVEMLKALASEPRIAILKYLTDRPAPINDIVRDLGLPSSTANMHIGVLERAGVVHTELRPASRGLQKVCARTYDEIVVALPRGERHARRAIELSMPVGGYTDVAAEPTCGLAGLEGIIGYLDDPSSFYEPERVLAHLLWFRTGYVEYRYPNRVPPGATIRALQLTAEVCSEAPLHDPDWPSDISVWINGRHLGAWTSPGDFGGKRGRLTPSWWHDTDSQYGLLKRWRITDAGTTIDGVALSNVALADCGLRPGVPIVVRIGVSPDAASVGGLNLFGRGFGNYPQDVGLRIEYDQDETARIDERGHAAAGGAVSTD
jgi:predicted transcriptional regulator